MNMKRKLLRYSVLAMCALIAVLLITCSATGNRAFGYWAIAAAAAAFLIVIILGRCPHCGKLLGYAYIRMRYCPFCGDKLDDDDK